MIILTVLDLFLWHMKVQSLNLRVHGCGFSIDLQYNERQETWVNQDGWDVERKIVGVVRKKGEWPVWLCVCVCVCTVAGAQWLSAEFYVPYTRVDWELHTGTPEEGKWLFHEGFYHVLL